MSPSPGPKTTLTAFDIACVVVGGIIGIGIFFSPSKVARVVDSPEQVIAAWTIGGVMILFGALVYARLAQIAPGEGGVFEYLRKAFGPLPAFLYGWCNLLIIQSGALAVVGLVMADNLQRALACEPFTPLQRVGIATTAIVVLTVINSVGLIVGKIVQIILTVIKTSAVFAIVLIAIFAEGRAEAPAVVARAEVPFLEAMSLAILPVLFACGGWQHGSFVATVARRPLRDVPVGIVAGVVVVIVAYLTVNLAYLDLLGLEGAADSKTIAVDAVSAAFSAGGTGDMVARCFGALIVISALGVMNTICMAPPYVLHAMARRRVFFASFGELNARFGTPLLAIVLNGAWAVSLLWITQLVAWEWNATLPPEHQVDPLGFLLDGVVFVDWLCYGACGVALVALLSRRPALERGDRAYFAAGVVFALCGLAVTVGAIATTLLPTLAGLTTIVLGLLAYRFFTRTTPVQ
jgi:basic amino acid/polyamine antiporter, APA family